MNNKNTIVLLNKKEGITSFSCLNIVKRIVNRKTGHCGTLDKFASGLIIALCGKYTKYNEKFIGLDKTYIAKIKFGEETDTLDPEGQIIDTKEVPDYETINNQVKNLIGEIDQVPPVYSALHVNGQRSYALARSGKEVRLDPRKVTIYSAEIISYEKPFLIIKLHVSKGTYIRSYARDIGHLCNSCAYLTELKRTSIGPFSLENAIDYDDSKKLELLEESSADYLISKLNSYNIITRNN